MYNKTLVKSSHTYGITIAWGSANITYLNKFKITENTILNFEINLK